MSRRLDSLYEQAAAARTDEFYARRHSHARAEEHRRRYRAIVDEIHRLNLERKRRERHEEIELDRDEPEAPAPRQDQWWSILGVSRYAQPFQINQAWKRLALKNHPDAGGSVEAMARINAARDQALGR